MIVSRTYISAAQTEIDCVVRSVNESDEWIMIGVFGPFTSEDQHTNLILSPNAFHNLLEAMNEYKEKLLERKADANHSFEMP